MGSGDQNFGFNEGRSGSSLLAAEPSRRLLLEPPKLYEGGHQTSWPWAEQRVGEEEVWQQGRQVFLQNSTVREREGSGKV